MGQMDPGATRLQQIGSPIPAVGRLEHDLRVGAGLGQLQRQPDRIVGDADDLQHQQRRDGWLEANAHLGPQYQQVVRSLAWQRRANGIAVEAERPGYVLEALGPVPPSTRGRRAWRQAAGEIEQYRRIYQVTDPDRALGPEPRNPAQRADRQRARTAIDRVHAKQRATDRTTTASRPPSAPASRDLMSSVAGQAPSGPPASTSRKEQADGEFPTVALRRG
jgi:hypothetical protein